MQTPTDLATYLRYRLVAGQAPPFVLATPPTFVKPHKSDVMQFAANRALGGRFIGVVHCFAVVALLKLADDLCWQLPAVPFRWLAYQPT